MTQITPATRANARRLRDEATPQERRLWSKLREVNHMLGTHFRRQAPLGRFIADFADYGRRLVIEVDGGQHGGTRDLARDAWLTSHGFVVLRFWNNEVDGNIEGVMQVVLDAVEAAAVAPPPQPSPTRGEGGALRPDQGSVVGPGSAIPQPFPSMGEGGALRPFQCVIVGPEAAPPQPLPAKGKGGAHPESGRASAGPGASPHPRGEGLGEGGETPIPSQKGTTP